MTPPKRVLQPCFSLTDGAIEILLSHPQPSVAEPMLGALLCWAEDLPHLSLDEVQPELLRWVLPSVLAAWQHAILGDIHALYFAWAWHRAIAYHPTLISACLGAPAEQAFVGRTRDLLLQACGRSRGIEHIDLRFWPFWNSVAVAWPRLVPDVLNGWHERIAPDTPWAYSALGFVSAWVLDPADSPIEAPWTATIRPWSQTASGVAPRWPIGAAQALRATLTPQWCRHAVAWALTKGDWTSLVAEDVLAAVESRFAARMNEVLTKLYEGHEGQWWASELGMDSYPPS
jgi:hypothetical protein